MRPNTILSFTAGEYFKEMLKNISKKIIQLAEQFQFKSLIKHIKSVSTFSRNALLFLQQCLFLILLKNSSYSSLFLFLTSHLSASSINSFYKIYLESLHFFIAPLSSCTHNFIIPWSWNSLLIRGYGSILTPFLIHFPPNIKVMF